ncbi:MAG: hypothetical protein U9R17_04365 [Thermodesulfobacteriota bacterium]|nr:hypothetical protein [Thermodesulfobacteriota bacterium]
MSQHFIERKQPPEGISSFTKIRLGWISQDQVLLVNPGSTKCVFLSPLSKMGETLAVKIPLKRKWSGGRSNFYLVENRQPIGYDLILPDSGILILKVNEDAMEGSGTVKVMDADPDSRHFSHATFRLDKNKRNYFIDKKNNVAIIPLWSEKGKKGVLITTPVKGPDALKAALMIQKLIKRFPEPRGENKRKLVEESISFFKRADFKTCCQISQQALQ